MIEDLNKKIASADVEQKVKDAATAASEKIFDMYGEIDSVLHGAEEEIKNIKFSDFGPAINKATKTLESLLLEAKEAVTGPKNTETTKQKAEDKPKAANKDSDEQKPAEEKESSEATTGDTAKDTDEQGSK